MFQHAPGRELEDRQPAVLRGARAANAVGMKRGRYFTQCLAGRPGGQDGGLDEVAPGRQVPQPHAGTGIEVDESPRHAPGQPLATGNERQFTDVAPSAVQLDCAAVRRAVEQVDSGLVCNR